MNNGATQPKIERNHDGGDSIPLFFCALHSVLLFPEESESEKTGREPHV